MPKSLEGQQQSRNTAKTQYAAWHLAQGCSCFSGPIGPCRAAPWISRREGGRGPNRHEGEQLPIGDGLQGMVEGIDLETAGQVVRMHPGIDADGGPGRDYVILIGVMAAGRRHGRRCGASDNADLPRP